MGTMLGNNLEATLIKWKLGSIQSTEVKNQFYQDHFDHRLIAVEFTDDDELQLSQTFDLCMSKGKSSVLKGGHISSGMWIGS